MGPVDLAEALKAVLPSRVPVWLWGPPGIGKSAIVRQVADGFKVRMLDVRAVLLDPVDLRGIPHINGGGRAHWAIPDFLPRDGYGILFLDELPQAAPLVQSACLQLCLDRRIGEYVLPAGWLIVAAGNRQQDRAGAHRVISPLLNRFCHFDLDVSLDDWENWAVTGATETASSTTLDGVFPPAPALEPIAVEIRSALRFRPALLNTFDPQSGERAFATPRSWDMLSRVFRGVPERLQLSVCAGCVGEGPAAEFLAHLRIHASLPAPADILRDPAAAPVPKEPAVMYALIGALVEHVRKAGAKTLGALCQYVARLPEEPAVLLMRDVVRIHPKIIDPKNGDPVALKWVSKNRHLLLGEASK